MMVPTKPRWTRFLSQGLVALPWGALIWLGARFDPNNRDQAFFYIGIPVGVEILMLVLIGVTLVRRMPAISAIKGLILLSILPYLLFYSGGV